MCVEVCICLDLTVERALLLEGLDVGHRQ